MNHTSDLVADLDRLSNIRTNFLDDTGIVTSYRAARRSVLVDVLPVGRIESHIDCLDFNKARAKFRNGGVGIYRPNSLGLDDDSFLRRHSYEKIKLSAIILRYRARNLVRCPRRDEKIGRFLPVFMLQSVA